MYRDHFKEIPPYRDIIPIHRLNVTPAHFGQFGLFLMRIHYTWHLWNFPHALTHVFRGLWYFSKVQKQNLHFCLLLNCMSSFLLVGVTVDCLKVVEIWPVIVATACQLRRFACFIVACSLGVFPLSCANVHKWQHFTSLFTSNTDDFGP